LRYGDECRLDMVRLEPHLRAREAERRQASCRKYLITDPIPGLLRRRPVISQPVRFDDQLQIGPALALIGKKRRSSSESVSANVGLSSTSRRARTPGRDDNSSSAERSCSGLITSRLSASLIAASS
jgi:hypothetical protein